MQRGERLVGAVLCSDEHHACAHVEGVEHIALRDAAHAREQGEDRRDAQRFLFNLRAQAVGNAARNVLIEAAAGDVTDGADIGGFDGR